MPEIFDSSSLSTLRSTEKHFTINGFSTAAQWWPSESTVASLPVIMLHGWLDNSASFDVLAPHLQQNRDCLAIDLAGHGLSDHQKGMTDYPLWSDVSSIYAIADQMGWDRFVLIGHSRGAMMALISAGVYPQRIAQLVFIDSIVPPTIAPESAAERLRSSIIEINRRIARKQSLYSTYDIALNARCNSRYAPVIKETAVSLARRGLRRVGDQYHWHADGKLWAASAVGLSHDMLTAFVDAVSQACIPCLLLLGRQGLVINSDIQAEIPRERLAQCEAVAKQLKAKVIKYDDGHFPHMEKAATQVAVDIQQFLTFPDEFLNR